MQRRLLRFLLLCVSDLQAIRTTKSCMLGVPSDAVHRFPTGVWRGGTASGYLDLPRDCRDAYPRGRRIIQQSVDSLTVSMSPSIPQEPLEELLSSPFARQQQLRVPELGEPASAGGATAATTLSSVPPLQTQRPTKDATSRLVLCPVPAHGVVQFAHRAFA